MKSCIKCKNRHCLLCSEGPYYADNCCRFDGCSAELKENPKQPPFIIEGQNLLRVYRCEKGHIYCSYWEWDEKKKEVINKSFRNFDGQWRFAEWPEPWQGFDFLPKDFQKELEKLLENVSA